MLTRYTAGGQRHLPVHTDQSDLSAIICLNSPDEYQGGGTYFLEHDVVVNCNAGGAVAFRGGEVSSAHAPRHAPPL